jgi:hypothetical protein
MDGSRATQQLPYRQAYRYPRRGDQNCCNWRTQHRAIAEWGRSTTGRINGDGGVDSCIHGLNQLTEVYHYEPLLRGTY